MTIVSTNTQSPVHLAAAAPPQKSGVAPVNPVEAPAKADTVQQQDGAPATQQQIGEAAKLLKEYVKPVAQNLQFSMDEDSGKTVIKVVDSETQQVLRQIPSEEMLKIAKTLDRLQGLLVRDTI